MDTGRLRWIADISAVLIGLATWTMDLLHLVEPCGYCRVQRTVIALLGVLLLLPVVKHWFTQCLGKTVAAVDASSACPSQENGSLSTMKTEWK